MALGRTIASLLVTAAVAATSACATREGTSAENAPLVVVPDPVGRWRGGRLLYLELAADGSYETFVLNGATIEGCANVAGAGLSSGTWRHAGARLSFEPRSEPTDLVLPFATVEGVVRGETLVLSHPAGELVLRRDEHDPSGR